MNGFRIDLFRTCAREGISQIQDAQKVLGHEINA